MISKTEMQGSDALDTSDSFEDDRGESVDGAHASEAQHMNAGARLRAAREAKRMELSHVAAQTRIPIRHLESIEEGRYHDLPSRTYAIGFSKNYARAVDLDREEIADLVRAELSNGESHRGSAERKLEPGDPAKVPSARLAWFGAIAALLLAVGVVSFYSSYFGAGSGPPPIAAETETETQTPVEATDEQLASETAPSEDAQVVFTAMEDDVWVRFYEPGGARLYEAIMQEGDAFEIPSDVEEPLINTGRPHLLAITIDGQDVAKLSDEQTTLGDVPVSAEALLARDETSDGAATGDDQDAVTD